MSAVALHKRIDMSELTSRVVRDVPLIGLSIDGYTTEVTVTEDIGDEGQTRGNKDCGGTHVE